MMFRLASRSKSCELATPRDRKELLRIISAYKDRLREVTADLDGVESDYKRLLGDKNRDVPTLAFLSRTQLLGRATQDLEERIAELEEMLGYGPYLIKAS